VAEALPSQRIVVVSDGAPFRRAAWDGASAALASLRPPSRRVGLPPGATVAEALPSQRIAVVIDGAPSDGDGNPVFERVPTDDRSEACPEESDGTGGMQPPQAGEARRKAVRGARRSVDGIASKSFLEGKPARRRVGPLDGVEQMGAFV
jgi:ribosomal protein S6E (S10)